MTGLLDIAANLTRKIRVAGTDLAINPLTLNHVMVMVQRFESFNALMKERGVKKEEQAQVAMTILAPDALAYVMVACTGGAELTRKERLLLGAPTSEGYAEKLSTARENKWKAAQEITKKLGAADQLAILDAMYELSFPDGIGPFVTRFMAAKNKMEAMGQEMNKRQESSSPEEPSDVFDLDDPKGRYGTPHPGKSMPGSPSSNATASIH